MAPPMPVPVQLQQQHNSVTSSMMPPPTAPPPQITSTILDNHHNNQHQYYHKYNIGTALVSTVSANSLISMNGASSSNLNPPPQTQRMSNNSNNHYNNNYQQPPTAQKATAANSPNFWDNYEHLCALQNQMPLQALKASLSTDMGANLQLNADKLKSADWDPLLNTMRVNKNLKLISFYSNYVQPGSSLQTAENNDNSKQQQHVAVGYAKLKKPPSIRNKERTNKLCRSIRECLTISHNLNKLELINIPLSVKDCAQIAKGLKVNRSIKILSLEKCLIGDEGLAVICKDIQNSNNLNRVNFSSCLLTHEGANILATLIKVHALKRHNEAWKDSLRYGRPDLDSMFGIRRITINSNHLIGDKGVQYLADAFKSDLWLKALDLQDCGITTQGAKYLLDGLKFNAMMHVLDVRLNVNIDRDTLQKIMEQVMINSSGNNTDYEWMDLTQTSSNTVAPNTITKQKSSSQLMQQTNSKQPVTNQQKVATNSVAATVTASAILPLNFNNNPVKKEKRIKKRRNTNVSFSKKPINQFNSSAISTSSVLSKMKRCKSTGSVVFVKSPSLQSTNQKNNNHNGAVTTSGGTSVGVPWRAAARANRFRVSNSCAYRRVNRNEDDELDEFEQEEIDELDDDNDTQGFEIQRRPHRHLNHHNQLKSNQTNKNKMITADVEQDDEELNEDDDDEEEEDNLNHLLMTSLTFDNDKFVSSSFSHNMNNGKKQPTTSAQIQSKQYQQQRRTINSTSSKSEFAQNLNKIKNVSVKDLLVILQKEQETKTQLESMLIHFRDENTKLKSNISVLRSKLEQQQRQLNQIEHQRQQSLSNRPNETNSNMNRTLLDDDKALEIIERTLYKYQNFLDFLRNAGFGKLIDIGEMNQLDQPDDQDDENHENESQFLKSSSKSPTKSRTTISDSKPASSSKNTQQQSLSDQQKYYFNKINKAKSKLNEMDESNSILIQSESKSKNKKSLLKSSNAKNIKNSNNESNNHDQIDKLLSNALEISRSYRRLNSSIINSTGIYNTNTTITNNNIKENKLENNKNDSNLEENEKNIPDINEIEETTDILLNQYQSMKKRTTVLAINTATDASSTRKAGKKMSNYVSPLSNKSSSNLEELTKNINHINSNSTSSVHIDIGGDDFKQTQQQQQMPPQHQQRIKTVSTASTTSPQTTVIAQVPFSQDIQSQASQRTNRMMIRQETSIKDDLEDDENDDNDKEIEDDNVSEVISEDSKYYFDDVSNLRPAQAKSNSANKASSVSEATSNQSAVASNKFIINRRKFDQDDNIRNMKQTGHIQDEEEDVEELEDEEDEDLENDDDQDDNDHDRHGQDDF